LRTNPILAGAALLLAAVAGPAHAAENPVYMGAGLGVQSVTNADDGITALFRVGAQLDEVTPGFGVEGEITHSLIDPEIGPNDREVTITTLGGYGVYTVPFPNRRVSLRARLGLLWEEFDPEGRGSDDELEISWGLGGEYRISSTLSAFVDYTRIEADVDHLAGGVQVHF
jgi:hypothetical protein